MSPSVLHVVIIVALIAAIVVISLFSEATWVVVPLSVCLAIAITDYL